MRHYVLLPFLGLLFPAGCGVFSSTVIVPYADATPPEILVNDFIVAGARGGIFDLEERRLVGEVAREHQLGLKFVAQDPESGIRSIAWRAAFSLPCASGETATWRLEAAQDIGPAGEGDVARMYVPLEKYFTLKRAYRDTPCSGAPAPGGPVEVHITATATNHFGAAIEREYHLTIVPSRLERTRIR